MEKEKKEKKSIKQEFEKLLLNNEKITYGLLAKAVGISIYRVKKYFKNRGVDLENYNQMPVDKKIDKKEQKKKLKMKVNEQKIKLETKDVKIKLTKK